MSPALLVTLRQVKAIDQDTGASPDEAVTFDILDRATVGVQVGDTTLKIAAEPGEDDEGRHGWTLHDPITDATPEIQTEVRRIARLGLESYGYLVWDGTKP